MGGRSPALTPQEAHRLGVAVVQQELSLAPHLSIAENIGLGAYSRRGGVVDYGRLATTVAEIAKELDLVESPDTPVGRLPLGRRQIVEIAKALCIKPRVLILDEPTSSLSAPDVAILMKLVRRLRDRGVAILYISHRLNEILDFCDYVTVLKDGSVTADRPLAGLDPDWSRPPDGGPRSPESVSAIRLACDRANSSCETKSFRAAGAIGVDFELHRGEILGIGGLVGHGQEDFMMGLYGAVPAEAEAVPRIHERRRRAERALRQGRRRERRRRRLRSGRSAQGRPASAALDRLQSAPAAVRQPQRRASPAGAGERDHRAPGAAPRHSWRPAAAGAGVVGRQPAEGRAFQMAGARAVGPAAERPDARRRRRDQARDLSRATRDGGGGQSRRPCSAPIRPNWSIFAIGSWCSTGAGWPPLCRTPRPPRRRSSRPRWACEERRRCKEKRFDAGPGGAPLLGDPVAPQRRPRRAVPRPRDVRRDLRDPLSRHFGRRARWPSSSRAGSRRRWSPRRKPSSC